MSPADSPFAPLPAAGPHPATAELRAYAAGTLSPADEHRIEAHTLDCERCAELVEGFSMTDAAATDQAVAALRTRLQARIGGAQPEVAAPGRAWPRLAAAAALLAVVGGGLWGWERHEHSAGTARLETAQPAPTEPAAPPTGPALPPPAETAVVAAAPETPKHADYAAMMPAQPRRRTAPRAPRRAHRPAAVLSKPMAVADRESLANNPTADVAAVAKEMPLTEAVAAAPPATSAAAGYNGEAPAEGTDKADKALAADSSAARRSAGASRLAKAKAFSSAAPAASVLNTPMPAAPSIAPSPIGGSSALRYYLRREASKFAPKEGERPLNGTVRVRFIVGADGKVSNLKVTHGMRADYDAEALRIVCDGPAWQPGIAGGRRAPLPMEVSISF